MPVLPLLSVSLVVDSDQRVSYLSPTSGELYGEHVAVGVRVPEALGEAWLTEQDDQPILEQLTRRGHWSGRTRHRTPGGLVPVTVDARLQVDFEGQPIGLHLEVRPASSGEDGGPPDPSADSGRVALDRLERLRAISARLVAVTSVGEIADVVCGEAVDGVGAFAAAVSLVAADGLHLDVVSSCGYPADLVPRWRCLTLDDDTPNAVAARTGEALWLESIDDLGDRFPGLQQQVPGGGLCVLPLHLAGRVLGTLGFSFATPRSFDRADQNFLLTISAHCAHAVDRVQSDTVPVPPGPPARQSVLVLETADLDAVSSRARRLLAQVVTAEVPRQLRSDLNIVVSELATNAAVHAGGPIRIIIECQDGSYRVRVDDTSRRPLEKRSPAVGEPGGRGLPIVEALSRRWGVEVHPWGKSVWAEVG